ncbi:transcriptional regulator, TetR family [Beutenbergia cavernae DSM 12333]|uniref:Transcriptional regulator, TetR family n=1 Tax=Beutenbergia cavernae (strain ATCC BAA-8 / DSM 12333 / CCUG 43141 / JCM 11478 / NBRC 16432 / NCIMB 13614 / HKI 0122) TaxID=471853 RepID=C5BXP9_BEUC1|nr:TetR/AcrR family transcriptional regulator [Beutenbergia cavernae]ACQ80932.1 transcriptional regulator, TetR family [Beutenbergia cavernae DSM 12333]
MPRLADHDERRHQITDAARRVVARGGLPAATFQSVAAEAGVSVRLVQYYFGSKREFLLATHRAVVMDAAERFAGRLADLGEGAAPHDVVRGVLMELLPTDPARREDAIVLEAFHNAALTGSEASAGDLLGAPRALVDLVAGQVRRARSTASGSAEATDAETDAWIVVLAASGLTQAMLIDAGFAADADTLVDRILNRFLPRH